MKITVLTLSLFSLLCGASPLLAQAQFTLVGHSPVGTVAYEYVGMVVQEGEQFETFGYFTYIHGIPEEALFFPDPEGGKDRTAEFARFTFHSESVMTSRSIVGKVFDVQVRGGMTMFIREAPEADADFSRGDEFSRGVAAATFQLRGQSIVTVLSPDLGVNSATLELSQTESLDGFQWEGRTYFVGKEGARLRFSHSGRGDRTQEEPIKATVAIAGHGISTGSEP